MTESSAAPVLLEPEAAQRVFGDRLPLARRYTELLAQHGPERGLIGPREIERLWDRHILNSAVVQSAFPANARVIDVGSGAGLPGIPLAIARPDLELTLLEPMERRVAWLNEVVADLGLPVNVVRGRAEEPAIRKQLADWDAVTARAVKSLSQLAQWCFPLLRPGGLLVALKGASAEEEITRDRKAISAAGGLEPRIVSCGADVLTVPTTVVVIERSPHARRANSGRRQRKDQ
ncbi:16S rRNA (guanine(527)-N(7))-methyltransferase RsmG [Pseudonocardiaceae bacterium YIM PH 21723]|nr:16S rRNA (guanine(527)-N(7))-methyltransferase RsmG [Pseudonocardiaceae bacterium YIM PH 21723]